jgi:beta-galactosidase/beta-glucuronidase
MEKGKKKQRIIWIVVWAVLTAFGTASAEQVVGYGALPRLTPRPTVTAAVAEPVLSLDGTWRFHPAPPSRFWEDPNDTALSWSEIEVPGEWVMQGFTVEKNTAAAYRRSFEVPADWKGQRVKLRFDAVYSEATVWVNGHWAGRHEGGFTPFELDVTDFLRPSGGNVVFVEVKNESLVDTLASGTQYAAHQLGGITRKVALLAVPQVHIASLHVTTQFDKDYRHATLHVAFDAANEGVSDVSDAHVRFELRHPDGRPVEIAPVVTALGVLRAGRIASHEVAIPVDSPKKWDAEHPHLYTLTAHLQVGTKPLEVVSRQFGFRQVEVRGNQLFVNGSPVKLRGICRHEVHPLRGRSLTPELWRKDAELFREANLNYIRTSHYPPAEEFVQACDELGLFVEEEAPLCWVGHGANAAWQKEDPHGFQLREAILRATAEMIQRDRSHPSVIIWSLANESAWGPNFEKSFELAGRADPSRALSFHDQCWGNYNNHGSRTPIANFHYPGPGGPARTAGTQRPVLFGEYCHLNTYNREEIITDPGVRDMWGLGFARMWNDMYEATGCLGGAIWSGLDDIFDLPSGTSVGYGAWGPLDGWRRPKPEYWHIKMAYSPVCVLDTVLQPPVKGEAITLRVANRHDFTNMAEVRIAWSLGEETGTVTADIPPRGAGTLSIRPRRTDLEGEELRLEFLSPRGFSIGTYVLPIGRRPAAPPVAQDKSRTGVAPRIVQTDDAISVEGEGFRWVFDRQTGQIRDARIGDRTVVTGGPTLMLLPLKGGECQPAHRPDIQPFNDSCGGWTAEQVAARQMENAVEVQVTGRYEEAHGVYRMTVDSQGGLTVNYRFTVDRAVNPRQTGIVFALPGTFDTLAWERESQWTAYPADHIGRPRGVARALPDDDRRETDARTEPTWPWSLDRLALGTNDFCATRTNILWASLKDRDENGLLVRSDGKQSARCWLQADVVRLLVAGFSTGGADMFFSSHLAKERKPLKNGDIVEDEVLLELRGQPKQPGR